MGKHLHSARSTENTKENVSDMAWLGGQKFSGWDNFFSTIVEKFYPRIKESFNFVLQVRRTNIYFVNYQF